jgi:hypothetical protein
MEIQFYPLSVRIRMIEVFLFDFRDGDRFYPVAPCSSKKWVQLD